MKFLVNDREAVLKAGTSFDYNVENRLFMGRDGFTLSLTFPLVDCPENVEIFGHLNRAEFNGRPTTLDCAIIDRGLTLSGSLLINEINDSEVKAQFAEGRCAQTASDPLSDRYINELTLGYPSGKASAVAPSTAWRGYDSGRPAVALPWVNNSYPLPPNNDAVYENGAYSWTEDTTELSWQPFLLVLTKLICAAVGYTCDFRTWEASPKRHLLVCNTLPAAWELRDYARALPHWTVSEYFEKLELALGCEFDFDHRAKSVEMKFTVDAVDEIPDVKIDDVVDEFSIAVSSDSDAGNCEYIGAKRLAYAEGDHALQPYYACDWFIGLSMIKRYPTLSELIAKNRRKTDSSNPFHDVVSWGESYSVDSRLSTVNALLYAADVDTYFVFRSIGVESLSKISDDGPAPYRFYTQVYVLQPVNVFGSGMPESDDVQTEEIEFVPACVMETDEEHGPLLFLSFSSYDENLDDDTLESDGTGIPPIRQPGPATRIEDGKDEGKSAYFDKIYIGYYDGTMPPMAKMPRPIIDEVTVYNDWTYSTNPGFSLRLSGGRTFSSQIPQLNPGEKFKFSWLSSTIPNPRARFYIKGRWFVCEKITATFTERGMSQLLKGEFYPMTER